MVHYVLPAGEAMRPLPFYLAMEEWVAKRFPDSEGFFAWQVEPTVIFGRNQQIDKEVDIDYCNTNGIRYYRRKSGGGCVFADPRNLMLSYITRPKTDIASTFSHYTALTASAMQSMGIPAEASGRNDITIDGRKVSGNAFYLTPEGMAIVHGTMLFDTDMSHMAKALTPSRSKLESKGVKSVESRVTMLKDHTSLSIDEFYKRLADMMCDETYHLSPADIAEVEAIAEPYFKTSWIMGHSERMNRRHSRRVEGVGQLDLAMEVTPDGHIADANLTGDFFPVADIDSALLQKLRGAKADPDAVAQAIEGIDVSRVIPGLERATFADIAESALANN